MADFTSIVNGWPLAKPQELLKRIALAEAHAAANPISDRQQRVLAEMKRAAATQAAGEGK